MDPVPPETTGDLGVAGEPNTFFAKIGPGGPYFRWAVALLIVVVLGALILLAMVLLPLFGGDKYQNPISKRLNGKLGSSETQVTITAPPTPTPIPYKVPTGAQTYRFSNGKDMKGPKVQVATIDPLDPSSGTKQTITIELESDSPVTSAVVVVLTDKNQKNVDLKLVSGEATKGTYEGSWEVNDSYLSMYAFQFIIKSSSGTYDNVMRIR